MNKIYKTEIGFDLNTFDGCEKEFLLSFNADEYSNVIYLDVELTIDYQLSQEELNFNIERIIFKDSSTINFNYNFKNIIELLEKKAQTYLENYI